MARPVQESFPLIKGMQASVERAGDELLATVRQVISVEVPKRLVLAEDLGISEQHLSDALKANGKHFALRWLPGVVRYDREHQVAALIAGWQGLRVQAKAPLSDAAYRRRMEAALRRAGAAGEAIRTDALTGEDEP